MKTARNPPGERYTHVDLTIQEKDTAPKFEETLGPNPEHPAEGSEKSPTRSGRALQQIAAAWAGIEKAHQLSGGTERYLENKVAIFREAYPDDCAKLLPYIEAECKIQGVVFSEALLHKPLGADRTKSNDSGDIKN